MAEGDVPGERSRQPSRQGVGPGSSGNQCEERRKAEYDDIAWWDFIEAERMSEDYQKLLGVGITRSLVAMRAEVSSTRIIGKIYIQLLLGLTFPWKEPSVFEPMKAYDRLRFEMELPHHNRAEG